MPSRSDGVRALWRVSRPFSDKMKTFRSQEACHRFIYNSLRTEWQSGLLTQIWRSDALDDEGQRIWVLYMDIDL